MTRKRVKARRRVKAPPVSRRVTVAQVLTLVESAVERVGELDALLADALHPLAVEHRYDLAYRLKQVETTVGQLEQTVARLAVTVADLERWAESWTGDDDGEGWKRGAP